MKHVLLIRHSLAEEREVDIAKKYFNVYTNRAFVPANSIVIGRYSVLPYYKELQVDLDVYGSKLINSVRQHYWIADIWNWYDDLKDVTFDTWRRLEDVPNDAFPIVIKGATNSAKWLWKTHMFAANRSDAVDVCSRLYNDSFLASQWLYYRRYERLKEYDVFQIGPPVTHEFRIFVMYGVVVGTGFYWSNVDKNELDIPQFDVPIGFINKIIKMIGDKAVFYVIDVGKTASGEWRLIEVNDGQMSGLSLVDADKLYKNMATVAKCKEDKS